MSEDFDNFMNTVSKLKDEPTKVYVLMKLGIRWDDDWTLISIHKTKIGAENAKKIKEDELDKYDLPCFDVKEIEVLD